MIIKKFQLVPYLKLSPDQAMCHPWDAAATRTPKPACDFNILSVYDHSSEPLKTTYDTWVGPIMNTTSPVNNSQTVKKLRRHRTSVSVRGQASRVPPVDMSVCQYVCVQVCWSYWWVTFGLWLRTLVCSVCSFVPWLGATTLLLEFWQHMLMTRRWLVAAAMVVVVVVQGGWWWWWWG